MDEKKLTYAEWAALAAASPQELLRDCEVQVFHAHGPGGQGVNTADSAVRMVHVPTGIVVTSRESRSQLQNRELCLAKLRRIFSEHSVAPKHRRATKPSKHQKEKRLQAKRQRSELKQLRRRVD